MPTFSRKVLRQTLGQSYTRDMTSGQTISILPSGTTGGVFYSPGLFADTSLTNQNLYENTFLRHNAGGYDYRVASFNAASGAFFTGQMINATVNFLDEFEVHTRLSATEKDRALDDTIRRLRVRQEVGFMVTVDNQAFFAIDTDASPYTISSVLDAYYFANPFGSLTRDMRRFDDIRIVTTATGRELRIKPTLMGSQQIVLDAILELTLGSGDTATLNIPDDRWVLAGAAAKCYDLMIQTAPGQNAGELAKRRSEWASEFTRLSGRFAPNYESKIRLNEVGE